MRHRISGRHLSRTSEHLKAMRRNMAQSLFQYGQVETTLVKAKEVRPFVERLITLARTNTLRSRQRIVAELGDRSLIARDEQEKYDAMSDAHRRKVLRARSGRRHRNGKVPAGYNKKKIPFVAQSAVERLIHEIAPRYKDRAGGYTRIIPLAKRRLGDNSDLAILQLVGEETPAETTRRKAKGQRRARVAARIQFYESQAGKKKGGKPQKAEATSKQPEKPAAQPDVEADSGEASKE